MAKSDVIRGSWYNSGFHGHFRSKSRSDFLCEYRHLAKPTPPQKFVGKSQSNPSKHPFSHHDNRNSFMNDALYFEQGLGRRRINNSTNRYQRDLLMWKPDRVTFERGDPSMSVYKVDYPIVPGSQNIRQKITRRPQSSFDDSRPVSTSYRYSHGADNPNKRALNAMSNDGLNTVINRKQKASFISGRESVASCMSWYAPPATTPAGTQTIPVEPKAESCLHSQSRPAETSVEKTTPVTSAPTMTPCRHTVEQTE